MDNGWILDTATEMDTAGLQHSRLGLIVSVLMDCCIILLPSFLPLLLLTLVQDPGIGLASKIV